MLPWSCCFGRSRAVPVSPVELPAGQRPGGLLDVGLAEPAVTEREQLHELAGQVLVRGLRGVVVAVEPDEQRGIDDQGLGQIGEGTAARRPRNVSFWRSIRPAIFTFCALVAK